MQRSRGFTLIELLVVIAIIAILAAILFPVFAQAREKARATSCLSNTKQLSLGIQMYIQDYDETFPYWNWGNSSDQGGCTNAALGCKQFGSMWFNAIYPYVKNAQIYSCPSTNDHSTLDQNLIWGWTYANDVTQVGIVSALATSTISYAGNQSIFEGDFNNFAAVTDATVDRPAQTMVLGDGYTGLSNYFGTRPDRNNPADPLHSFIITRMAYANAPANCWSDTIDCGAAQNNNGLGLVSDFGTYATEYNQQARHTGGENIGFADGHAKFMHDTSITLDLVFGDYAN